MCDCRASPQTSSPYEPHSYTAASHGAKVQNVIMAHLMLCMEARKALVPQQLSCASNALCTAVYWNEKRVRRC